MDISVVMATWGRSALLARALDALERQDFPSDRFELILVVDGPGCDTPELLSARSARNPRQLRYTVLPRKSGPAAARNAGLDLARGLVVAFTDDDCVPSPAWLTEIWRTLKTHPEAGGLIGMTVVDESPLTPFSHYVENTEGKSHQTCNAAYRRSLLAELGGFDPEYPFSNEDTDLYLRAAARAPLLFAPEVRVVHPPREVAFSQIVRRARLAEGDFVFYRKHPDTYRKRHRGHGPVYSLLVYTGFKHFLALARQHFPYGRSHPIDYLKFLAACVLERLYLLILLPRFWWQHRSRS